LFDRDGGDAETLAFAVDAFAVNGCPPVFIAPGNHDPASATSPLWSPRLLAARGWAWPARVHVFATPHWSAKPLEKRPIRIWGRCFTAGVASTGRPLAPASLAAFVPKPPTLDVALFHGSLEGRCPPGQSVAGPFTEDEALEAPFAYMAVGHYHLPARLDDRGTHSPGAGVRLAYAGSAVALDVTEYGPHGALEVRIEYGSGKPAVEIDPLVLDRRRVHEINVDVSGASSADQVDRRIAAAFDQASVSERDIVTVRLEGRLKRGVRYSAGSELEARAFHLRLDLKAIRPDYDLEALRRGEQGATEERFARALLDRLDAESDPAERSTIESALYYGLDAFRLREVSPAYEELGE
jgi:DNA repair exonuclease SbcCD nuclease subunit